MEDLTCEEFSLPNGLGVVLHHDRSLPLVAVNLWYYVGSKDEPAGRSGFAHLFEHLMFMGTEQVPGTTFDKIMEEGGGSNNASTSRDRTNFYSSGPSNLLPTLLWLEADRMQNLGRCMTQEKLDLQRDVVRNERRQSYENRPYGKLWLLLPRMLYPAHHPYHMPVIGSHEDLVAATVSDVQEFFATWYGPSNAGLVVAGDFDPKVVRGMVQDLFADIPAAPQPPRRGAPPAQLEVLERRSLEDRVPAPHTHMAWHSPGHFQPGDAEMDVLASILADGAASRLEQALIHRRQLAENVSALQQSGRLGSSLHVAATALPGVTLDEIETVIDEELARLLEDGPQEEELARVVASTEAAFVRGLESLQERADLLNAYKDVHGQPGAVQRDLQRYLQATPQGVSSHARAVLQPNRRCVLRIVPEGSLSRVAGTGLVPDRRPDAGQTPAWKPPLPERQSLEGHTIWVVARKTVPLVNLQLLVEGGCVLEPDARVGQESLFCELLCQGAGKLDAAGLNTALDLLGCELSAGARRTYHAIRLSVPSRNLDQALDLLCQMLLESPLTLEDFQRVKKLRQAALEQRRRQPDRIASLVANRTLFGEGHAWGHPILGFEQSVAALEHEHLLAAYESFRAALASSSVMAAGLLDSGELSQKLAGRLPGPPTSGQLPARSFSFPDATPLRLLFVGRPKAPQTTIRFLSLAPPITSADTPALWLANAIFGGSFSSRLNINLRERHGFTYGAGSAFMQGAHVGTFVASSSVKAEVTGRALEEFQNEFERMGAADFTQEELERARATQRTQGIKAFEETAGATGLYAHLLATQLEAETIPNLYAALEDVSLVDLNRVAAAHMSGQQGVVVLVGDPDVCLPQLEDLHLPALARADEEGRLL